MICQLTQNRMHFQDRVLHVANEQKAELERLINEVGVQVQWFTGASAISTYSDHGEPDFTNPSSWILATYTEDDAQAIQAVLDKG